MRNVLAYTAARVVIFAVTAGVLYLLGARKLLLFAVAVLVSGVVSYVLLSAQRDRMSSSFTALGDRIRRRYEAARTKEDPPVPPASRGQAR